MNGTLVDVVSATRYSEKDFWNMSALGCSLRRSADDRRFVTHIAYENARGLPQVYNESIDSERSAEFVLFVHDDVWIDDIFWIDRLVDALHMYDIVGLAGNTRRVPNQPAWCFLWSDGNKNLRLDDLENLSGSVAHGIHPFGNTTRLGPSGQPCELIDGLFIAGKKSVLKEQKLRFDDKFQFHFYDLDFCRSVRSKNLKLGTWPISVTHQSQGAFGSEAWWRAYREYIGKWKE